ncbi:hypothetical protein M0D69_03805 [Caballeronia sp. SEWSISQ10-4 2]|uniref:hypothetical protein n=1 Tax=Caballeronia sp. SEWSISQ10-4 2 TaxID=2937438 RepID=UPI00264D18CE|nr:hypothetical protein [Caballeronia sp. SEWSISQ10-4 2]MDN7177148.1 hypothetical protein [Caballeronia sp. SEWSISQ10-4 2]
MSAIKAAKVVYECGRKLYHLEAVRLNFGENAAVGHVREVLQHEEGLTAADAAIPAGPFLKDVDRLRGGFYGFRELHRQLNKQAVELTADETGEACRKSPSCATEDDAAHVALFREDGLLPFASEDCAHSSVDQRERQTGREYELCVTSIVDALLHGKEKLLPLGYRAWFLPVLPGSRWNEPGGIRDGISEGIVFRCQAFVVFFENARRISQGSPCEADNCQRDFSVSVTVSSLSKRAEGPSPQGAQSSIDNRVGMLIRRQNWNLKYEQTGH